MHDTLFILGNGFDLAHGLPTKYCESNEASVYNKLSPYIDFAHFLGENYSTDQENLYAFENVNDYTTISVIDAGYLGNDYRTISERTENLAKGIADGIICYVENDTVGNIYKARPVTTVTSSTQKIYMMPLSEAMAEDL